MLAVLFLIFLSSAKRQWSIGALLLEASTHGRLSTISSLSIEWTVVSTTSKANNVILAKDIGAFGCGDQRGEVKAPP